LKKLFIILIVAFITLSVLIPQQTKAQSPEKMSYQAVIRNNSNALVANTQIGMEINIRQGTLSGTVVYTETQTPTTNANGLVSIEIGGGAGFSSIDWANNIYFIETKTAIAPPLTTYTIITTSQLLSVPYALHSKTAETLTGGITETDPLFSAWGKDYNDLINTPTIPSVPVNVSAFANDVGYLTTLSETDPHWAASPSFGITSTNISNWTTAVGWGNHATAGYLTNFTETDPLFAVSPANGITITNITNWNSAFAWGNHAGLYRPAAWVPSWADVTGKPTFATVATSGSYTDLTNKPIIPAAADGAETKVTAGTNITVTGSGTMASPYVVSTTPGTAVGQMQYWNGNAWVLVAVTANQGAVLQMISGVPTWVGGIPPNVTNPTTGKIWMDRNLGASQVAISSTDAASYGDLYQWGRGGDGHQIRTSNTTSTLSSTDIPSHPNFIINNSSPFDWRNPQNNNLWQGSSGINNPCPSGYRLPTEAEWNAERLSWSSNNASGAFGSPLKLPLAGARNSDGLFFADGTDGAYWSSNVSSTLSRALDFFNNGAGINSFYRTDGISVRCIKD